MLPLVTQHANLEFYNAPMGYNAREYGTKLAQTACTVQRRKVAQGHGHHCVVSSTCR